MNTIVRFKKLVEEAAAPYRGSAESSGYDLTATSVKYDPEYDVYVIGFGIAVELPLGHGGFLFMRSSAYKIRQALTNCVGVIDRDYRGELKAHLRRPSSRRAGEDAYKVGDRVCQLIVLPVPSIEYEQVETLSVTDRGSNGYGSSGR